MQQIRVGYTRRTYQEKRFIIGIVDGVKYKRVYDPYLLVSALNHKMRKVEGNPLYRWVHRRHINYLFNDLRLNHVDLVHFHNTISYGKRPWITTFETFLPRFLFGQYDEAGGDPLHRLKTNPYMRRGLDAIAGDACKRILAMSDCARNLQRKVLNLFPEYRQEIEDKMLITHPAQDISVAAVREKEIDYEGPLRFIMVGADFFRKGGMEILEAFQKLVRQSGLELKLTVVSRMHIGDHATRCSEEDLLKAKAIIGANADWIEYHPVLPNTQVLDRMKKSHVGLLPTWADTYGFVVLEYQSCGCPVITTDVRALPEINNPDIGWLIEVPKDEWGEAFYQTAEQRAGLRGAILRQLDTVVKSLYADRQGIRERAARAIEHVREKHSPQAYADRMKAIYGEALGVSIQ